MSLYRRYFVPGGTYFFTVVAYGRVALFQSPSAREILGRALRRCLAKYPFEMIAIVLLPEHLHTVWALPPGDADYSRRWSWTKSEFTKEWLVTGGANVQPRAASREGRRSVWQRRFWEHTIRDEADLEAHVDYIHYNPVKHGLVSRVRDWPWSSFHQWVERGHYSIDWGSGISAPTVPGNAGE
jgi:putative transposase